MEGSRILSFKRANQEGAALPVSAAPAAPDKVPASANKGDILVKAAAPFVGRVREAALALERLAKAESEQEKGRGQRRAGSKGTLGDVPESLKRGPFTTKPVPAAVGAAAANARAEPVGAEDGQEGKHSLPKLALPVESSQSGEGVERVVKQPESPVSDTPKSVLGVSNGSWGVTLLRPTGGKDEQGVLEDGKSEPTAAGGGMTRSGGGSVEAAGGSVEEGGRLSVRSLLQRWTNQEVRLPTLVSRVLPFWTDFGNLKPTGFLQPTIARLMFGPVLHHAHGAIRSSLCQPNI